LGSTENAQELLLVVLRSKYIIEIIMLQETRGSKVNIPGYKRYDSCWTFDSRGYPIHGVTTFTLDIETKDGFKLLTEKIDPDDFLSKITVKEKSNLDKISIIIVKALKIKFNNKDDPTDFDFNEDQRFSLHTNFYTPRAESDFASNIAQLLFEKVLPAINAQVGQGKKYKENQMYCDSNAFNCKWTIDRVPTLVRGGDKNRNLIKKMFDKNKDLHQHVNFKTSLTPESKNLIDLIIATRK